MTSIQQSRLYFLIGLPFEDTIVKKIALSKPAPEIIECCRKQSAKAHHHGTHIWTSPVKVKEMAEIMKRILIRNLPDHRITLENNYRWLIADLDRLDQYIRSRLQKLNDCYIIVYHPAWDYYAEEYGLTQIAIESDGKETSAKSLTRIIDLAVSKNIRTIFVQRQFSRGYAEIIARQLKADIIELNPLAEDYINNLYHVTDAIVASKQPL